MGSRTAPNQDASGDTPLVRWMKAGRPRLPLSEAAAQRCVQAIGRIMRDGHPAHALGDVTVAPSESEIAPDQDLKQSGRGKVYFLECCGCIKIGFTEGHPPARMAQLQPGCPFPLRLWAVAKGRLREEQAFHKQFHAKRLLCEWFRLEAGDLEDLRQWILGRGGRVYE